MVTSVAGYTREMCPNTEEMGKKYEGYAKNRFVKGYDGFCVTDSHRKDLRLCHCPLPAIHLSFLQCIAALFALCYLNMADLTVNPSSPYLM